MVWSDDKAELPVESGDFVVDKSEIDISTSVSRFGAGIPVWRVGVIESILCWEIEKLMCTKFKKSAG